jgi:hypothetical protein
MRVVNNLTKPGDIRRVDLTPDTVRIETANGENRIYRIVIAVKKEVNDDVQEVNAEANR